MTDRPECMCDYCGEAQDHPTRVCDDCWQAVCDDCWGEHCLEMGCIDPDDEEEPAHAAP